MEPEAWTAPPGDRIPNNPKFPVLLYRGVEAAAEGADAMGAPPEDPVGGPRWA